MKGNAMDTEKKITTLLKSTKRAGIKELIGLMQRGGFFTDPASGRYHGCYEGGLANHVYRVYELLLYHNQKMQLGEPLAPGQNPLPLTTANIIIASLLHDLCKMGSYLKTKDGGWTYDRKAPKGHATLSIMRIKSYIELEPIEEMMIRFHMGVYGCKEFEPKNGEYNLRGDHIACEGMSKEESKEFRYGKSLANAWYHNPVVKMISICDEIATLEEKE